MCHWNKFHGPDHTSVGAQGEISTGGVNIYSIYNVSRFLPRLHQPWATDDGAFTFYSLFAVCGNKMRAAKRAVDYGGGAAEYANRAEWFAIASWWDKPSLRYTSRNLSITLLIYVFQKGKAYQVHFSQRKYIQT